MAGVFQDKPDEPPRTVAVPISREAVEEHVKGGPFSGAPTFRAGRPP